MLKTNNLFAYLSRLQSNKILLFCLMYLEYSVKLKRTPYTEYFGRPNK